MKFLFFVLALFAACVASAQDKPVFEPGPPAYAVATQPLVLQKDDAFILRNRGIIVSNDTYPDGAKVSFDWTWTEGVEEGKYHDHLCVAVLTGGAQRKKWSHELSNGVVVRFNPANGGIGIEGWQADKGESELLAFKDGLTFEKNKKYTIVVEYTKTGISVSVDGNVVVEEKIPENYRGGGGKVAFYNRESVAGVPHACTISNLEVMKK